MDLESWPGTLETEPGSVLGAAATRHCEWLAVGQGCRYFMAVPRRKLLYGDHANAG